MHEILETLSESFNQINPWIFLGLVILYFVLDMLYSNYVISIGRLKAIKTANYSALLIFLTAIAVIEYVQNIWYLLPICIGAWGGSFVSIKIELKQKNKRIAAAKAAKLKKKIFN